MAFPSLKKIISALMKVIVALLVLGLGGVGYNYLVATKPEVPLRPRAEDVRKVAVVKAEIVSAEPRHQAFGTVTAARVSDLRFPISGEVEGVSAVMRNGAIVQSGQELARLDTELLELAVSDISVQLRSEAANNVELSTQLDLRKRQFERVNQMQAASVASVKRLDEARLALSMAQNALQQSTARIEQMRIQKQRAERNLRDAVLRAPFDGVLSNVVIGAGQVLNSGNILGKITDLSSLEVSFIVPAETYAISPDLMGREVEVTWAAGGRDVVSVMGKIERAEGNVSANEGGGRLYASLPNGSARDLPPIPTGAFVEIVYPSQRLDNIVILPESAIFDQDKIFVVKDQRADQRMVTILTKTEGKVYLRGDISANEEVIITRIPGLSQGTLVEVLEQGAN